MEMKWLVLSHHFSRHPRWHCISVIEKADVFLPLSDATQHVHIQALAMFWYLDNHNDIWKTSGIKDEDITEVNFCPACGVEALEDEAR